MDEGGLWKWSISPCGSSVRRTWGSFTGALKVTREMLWRQVSLPIGAPMGNLEGTSFTKDFAR